MLAVWRDHGVGVQLTSILLDGGARASTFATTFSRVLRSDGRPFWGRVEMVKLFLARGADPVEADATPWATPRAWARENAEA